MSRKISALTATVAAALMLASCGTAAPNTTSDSGADTTPPAASANPETPSGTGEEAEVVLVTHDSFYLPEELLAEFTADTGLEVSIVAPGDGGALANQLVLTKDAPLGDVVYGLDNTFAGRALEAEVFAAYQSTAPAAADAAQYAIDDSGYLTAIDFSDVCLNIDEQWFIEQGKPVPVNFDDLLRPEFAGLTVVTNAATSSPGFAFLVATIGAKGDDWGTFWQGLVDNGLRVAEGWSEAYYVDFSGSGEGGQYPIALSYASSPPATVAEGADSPRTSALLNTCFRQVEYAGVLAGGQNPEGAQLLIDWLLSDEVQSALVENMWMYPVSTAVELPAEWASWAPLADQPWQVSPAEIETNRADWISQWTEIVTG